jgi:hypothetical protein
VHIHTELHCVHAESVKTLTETSYHITVIHGDVDNVTQMITTRFIITCMTQPDMQRDSFAATHSLFYVIRQSLKL